jgi:DNA modification methylase
MDSPFQKHNPLGLHNQYIGYELEQEYFDIAKARLEAWE